ncbi:MAG: DUF6055 domain-containing protein [Nocardioides sp.]
MSSETGSMRRLAALTGCTVLTVTALLVSGAGTPSAGAPSAGAPSAGAGSAGVRASRALHEAQQVLAGREPRADGSMALLDLRQSMPALSPAEHRRAVRILARPTDDPDPYGEAYRTKAKRACAGHICLHWVTTTRDRAPSRTWVDRMLRMMNKIWDFEVGELGYHRPISDGSRGGGGSGRFDVYLKELYHQGLYGLTVAEKRSPDDKHLFSSYLLLDNDFARSQYHENPMQLARVTAAHEFFHAIQDAYDADADRWLMESTATWMEEQYDDASNDNRQYLPWSQLAHPGTPLDTYSTTSFEEYGNWAFFEYLSERYGRGVVKSIWKHDATFAGGGREYSAAAIRSALHRHGGMTSIFGSYASGNTVPAQTYAEGAHFPTAGVARTVTLDRSTPGTSWASYRVKHLASVNLRAVPGTDLTGRSWRLRVQVDGPARSTMPAVVVLVARQHRLTSTQVPLSRDGRGQVGVPFGRATTRQVTVTLANTSTRFHCHTGGDFSCHGTPTAAHPTFRLRLRAVHS